MELNEIKLKLNAYYKKENANLENLSWIQISMLQNLQKMRELMNPSFFMPITYNQSALGKVVILFRRAARRFLRFFLFPFETQLSAYLKANYELSEKIAELLPAIVEAQEKQKNRIAQYEYLEKRMWELEAEMEELNKQLHRSSETTGIVN